MRSSTPRLALLHSKNENAFPGRAPHEKASGYLVRRRLYLRWIQDYGHPGFIVTPPRELTSLHSLATHAATRRVAKYQTLFYNFGQSVSREKAYHSYSKKPIPSQPKTALSKRISLYNQLAIIVPTVWTEACYVITGFPSSLPG